METRTYADVKPQGLAGWCAPRCRFGAPVMPAFAVEQGGVDLHSTTRNDDIVRPMGPFGWSTG